MSKPSAATAAGEPLRILFAPLPSPGHIIPMIDIAKLFASRGADSTIVLTPLNAARFESTIARARSAGFPIRLQIFSFPSESSLPSGCESTDSLPDRALSVPFTRAVDLLRIEFDEFARSNPPDAIVSDLLLPWTASVAAELGIPRYVFPGTGCFALSVELAVLLNRLEIGSRDRFVVPGLPHEISLTRAKLAEATLPAGEETKELFKRLRESEQNTVGTVFNSFADLEPEYKDFYERMTGKPAWLVGPISLCNKDPSDMAERGRGDASADVDRIFKWLDSKRTGSVLYVCFGSLCRFPLAQLKEIGFGLEESEVDFLWVIREGEVGRSNDEWKWMEELEGRVEGRGLVVKGWAPQIAILSHVAVGAFMSHCGWGSVTEASAAGVAVLTWPLFAEQFYNEELVVEVVGLGKRVGAEVGFTWGEEEKTGVAVGSEKIKEKAKWIMGKEKEVEEVREKARNIGEKARQAVEGRGASHETIGKLMEDMLTRSRRQ